jgi:hypothetical protein
MFLKGDISQKILHDFAVAKYLGNIPLNIRWPPKNFLKPQIFVGVTAWGSHLPTVEIDIAFRQFPSLSQCERRSPT